jgi:hypothetical protein
MAAVAGLWAFGAPDASAAITHKGRIAGNNQSGIVVIKTDNTVSSLAIPALKVLFRTTAPGDYKLRFCFGPATDPCGTGSYSVGLAGEDEALAVIHPQRLRNGVLHVSADGGLASGDPIPFEVVIE